ncbi:PQQ-binding-like beta-propeller repeat protein [Pseudolysobacter antarcticus]|nr:PQQ-binding-like beta-propeller repeat protein [Pseudolysobacter antarcticus]
MTDLLMPRKIFQPFFYLICAAISAFGICGSSFAEIAPWETSWFLPAPLVSTGKAIAGSSFMDGTQNILNESLLSDGLHFRRLSAVDGSVLWDIVDNDSWTTSPNSGWSQATNNDTIVIAAATHSSFYPYPSGMSLAAFDRNTGEKRWVTYYLGALGAAPIAPSLLSDGAGNFFLAAGGMVQCCYNNGGQSVIKFAGADGTILWRRDADVVGNQSQAIPPAITVSGTDVVVAGSFESMPTVSKLVKLSGVDGTTLWNSSAYAPSALYATHDGNLVTFLRSGGFAKINSADGSLLWTESADDGCGGNCSYNGFQEMSNGDFLFVGSVSYPDERPDMPWLFHLRGDGGGVAYAGNPTLPAPSIAGFIIQAMPSVDGNAWLRFSQYTNSYHGLAWLAKYNLTTHTVTTSQVAALRPPTDAQTPSGYINLLANPSANRLLVSRTDYKSDGTQATVDALLDNTIAAQGDLDIVVTSPKVIPHGGIAHISMTVHYTGDVAIVGVKLFGVLPLPLSGNLICSTQGASNCTTDVSAGHLHASFDLIPGGQVTVSADLLGVNSESQMWIEGILYGPMSLSEPSIKNNFSTTPIAETLFASGFE